ncbi:MAG: hypothetical protein IJK24_07195 [Oscillospiraceae bacterium]|nr:hypothetical protein [Oscillospiraceae bacterium]
MPENTEYEKKDVLKLNDQQKDFTYQFHKKVNNVIGGDNPNQKLILLLPGIALTMEDFEYDYKNHADKGPTVEANESRLANKLYDPCSICGADNGRMLPHQYKSALDALTPKLNFEIAKSKNELRDLLLSKYPYKFNLESDTEINTFQEVFFRLYDDYVKTLEAWSKLQSSKREEFNKKYEAQKNAAEATNNQEELKRINTKINNDYLQWYEDNAYSSLNAVNQKMSTLLSVFSENDMKIIEGILDSGSGAELQEARATMRNLRKLTPDGGYIYPVKFNPTNWFELLDTSEKYKAGFKEGIDLLDSPTVLFEKMSNLLKRKRSVSAKLDAMKGLVPDDNDVKAAATALAQANTEYDKAFKNMESAGTTAFANFTKTLAGMITGICLLPSSAGRSEIISSVVKPYIISEDKTTLIKNIQDQGTTVSDKADALNKAIKTYTSALAKSAKISNNKNLSRTRDALQAELDEIEAQIEEISTSAVYAQCMSTNEDISSRITPEGYSFFYIKHEQGESHDFSKEDITVSTNTKSKGFWIFKKKTTNTETKTDFESLCESENATIEIAMNIAKIGIEREWFNPGVFVLSDDMYHLTTKRISSQFDAKNFNADDYIFPCFPVAMLLARDVTIKLNVMAESYFSKVHEAVKEASTAKSYVFYNSGSGSKTTSTTNQNDSGKEYMSIIIKIPTPQIIGYYLENTPEDKSLPYNSETDDNKKDIVNIRKYVEEYMTVIKKKMKELESQ